jgi:hypothetical protein
MLKAVGFVKLRPGGRGDHTIYGRGTERVSLDGEPNHEVPMPVWAKLRKKYGLKDE